MSTPSEPSGEVSFPPSQTWSPVSSDLNLSSQVRGGLPAMTPAGADLDLRMGWDRFEQFALALIKRTHGAGNFQFRRYGVLGQAQHGIDLVGRGLDRSYVVVQCKEYASFSAADLRAAVERFARGRRPFGASTFLVMTSALTQSTQCVDELARLQDQHPELVLDLWGSEEINERLRLYPDVVGRFWTRETADVFCTGAPLQGAPAPPLDRQQQAERILLGPLRTTEVAQVLREAESIRESDPVRSTQLLGDVASRLDEAHFVGHAFVLRRRQLDVLTEASLIDEAVALAADLAVTALMRADRDTANELVHRLRGLTDTTLGAAVSPQETASVQGRHLQLIEAAFADSTRPFGSPTRLITALGAIPGGSQFGYHPALVLLLAEDLFATEPELLPGIDDLLRTAIVAAEQQPESDLVLRLRLVLAEYDTDVRTDLVRSARRLIVPRRAAALIAAREGRRCAIDGRAEDALEAWRDAVSHGIEAGLDQEAATWLYAIRAVNARYGPLTDRIDEEHRLAQALRATGVGRFLDRPRNPREAAMAALVSSRRIPPVLDARRWLIDTCVTGSWASENEATIFLADRYAQSGEAPRAAVLYQRAGEVKKLVELAEAVGDTLLPIGPLDDQPWWVLVATLNQVSAQEDLLPSDVASDLLTAVIGVARRGQTGKLVDSPFLHLTTRSLTTTCDLAHRGTPEQAIEVLDLLSPYVDREPNHGWPSDKPHALCCLAISLAHPTLAYLAMTRLVALAAADAQDAQKVLLHDPVKPLLTGDDADHVLSPTYVDLLSVSERADLRSQVIRLAEDGHYLADVALESVAPEHEMVQDRARAAKDRILDREDPNPGIVSYGTGIPKDSYLVSLLPNEDSQPCLEKLLFIANDHREAAKNRQDALIGARNLVINQPLEVRSTALKQAKALLTDPHEPSAFDQFTGNPHPLSTFQVSMGSASLLGDALKLAHAAIAHSGDTAQEQWILRQAVVLLDSPDERDRYCAAVVIHQLPPEVTTSLDAALIATRNENVRRQVAATLTVREPERYTDLLLVQARDPAHQVRRTLAEAIARLDPPLPPPLNSIRDILSTDVRHSVRQCFADQPGSTPAEGLN